MGRYMTVVLKKAYRQDAFIHALNRELAERFGAEISPVFNSWQFLQEEADFFNTDPEGKTQIPHWPRPVTKEALHDNFFWYRMGEFSFKLSGGGTATEAKDAVAVCKWLVQTECRYIDKKHSENYTPDIVQQYLNNLFEEEGYDLNKLWELPQQKSGDQ